MTQRNDELDYQGVVEKYPDAPPMFVRKIDTNLRGVTLTDRARERARDSKALFEVDKPILGEVLFRDGSLVGGVDYVAQMMGKALRKGEPYTLDVIDDRLMLLDGREPVEECFFSPLPEYYGKKTSQSVPMHQVAYVGPPECLNIAVFGYCHFWKEKVPCKYCSFQACFLQESLPSQEDIYETVTEALKETGRWTGFRLVAGSDPRGSQPYDNEVEEYLKVLQTLRRCFETTRLPARLVASAFSESQQARLAEAGAMAYECHLEVWDETLFEWVCPGKARWCGREYWIESSLASVKVFGQGHVCNQFVGGAEFTGPNAFESIEEALASSLAGAEFFAEHGIGTTSCVLWVARGSVFYGQKQKAAPLEYYVRLARGLSELRRKYRIGIDFNDYRRCGIHPDADLSRLHYQETAEV